MGRQRRRENRAAGAGTLPGTIAALSRALPAGPNPETFRRAKFDRPQAVPAFWQLLSKLLSPASTVKGQAASRPLEAQVRLVKSTLCSQGYPRRWALAQLPEDGSQGSRELLLALAWLLARGPLLEQLLECSRLRLGDEMCLCQCEALASRGLPAACVDADGPVDIRQLQWLLGKLRFRWRSLWSLQQEQYALMAKIHWYTRGCWWNRTQGHLSVAETEMLRDPRHGQQLLQSLEQENERLEAAATWRHSQLVFWQWVDAVLSTCPSESSLPSRPTALPRIPSRALDELELLFWELQALHKELREAVQARRAAWKARAASLGHQELAWHRIWQENVAQELAALRRTWEQDGGPEPFHGSYRLVRQDAKGPEDLVLQTTEAVNALSSQEAFLEAMLQQLQGQCQQELGRLVGAHPGLIWILPSRR